MPPITLFPIGTIYTPFKNKGEAPRQPLFSNNAEGRAEILPEFAQGLSDLEGFERIWLIWNFHLASQYRLRVTPPFPGAGERGVFATRAPCRPCPIALSCVKLLSIKDSILYLAGVDMLNGTPLLDIKPYVPNLDAHPETKSGWLESKFNV